MKKKVKVRWISRNPFVDFGRLRCVSEADIDDHISIGQVIGLAKDATPNGYYLFEIDIAGAIYGFDLNGNLITEPTQLGK